MFSVDSEWRHCRNCSLPFSYPKQLAETRTDGRPLFCPGCGCNAKVVDESRDKWLDLAGERQRSKHLSACLNGYKGAVKQLRAKAQRLRAELKKLRAGIPAGDR